jgi:hypothetical protein
VGGCSPHFTAKYMKASAEASGDAVVENKMLADHLARGGGRNLVSARAAVDMVESGKHFSVAFSKHFCVNLRPRFKFPVLMLNGTMVGVYADGAFWVLPKHLHFRDFFQKKWGVDLLNMAEYKKEVRAS